MTAQLAGRYLIEAAGFIAHTAHHGQTRKYTGEQYIEHPRAVADIVERHGFGPHVIAAALLHDVLEDTDVTMADLEALGNMPGDVMALVDYMTERHHDGNRAARKAAECARLAKGNIEAQSLKLADLIDNTGSIVEHDPKFAKVYLPEKAALIAALTDALPAIRAEAQATLDTAVAALENRT